MLKVLYLTPVGDFKGGAEATLFDLLRNPHVSPVLAVPTADAMKVQAEVEGVAVEVLPIGRVAEVHRPLKVASALLALPDWIRAAVRLRRVARRHGADLIHSNGLKAHCIGLLCRLMGGPPLLAHIHDIPFDWRERTVWRLIARISDLTLVVSRPCWPDPGPLPARVDVLHNGLDVDALPALPARPRGRPLTLGFCGRLHAFKGVDVLLGWCAQAKGAGLDFRLIIRGEAAPADAAYERLLHAEVARLALEDRVVFEGKQRTLPEIYGGLDLVVVPSVTPDPLPRSVMEAMGLGLPVIGYPAGGVPDMIDDGADGWLVRDGAQFTRVLKRLSDDPKLLKRFGDRASVKIRDRFSLASLYAALNAHYDRLGGGV